MKKVFVYDSTLKDKKSAVRGIGRYLQILKESFGNSWIFTDNIKRISADSVFINPFYNLLQRSLTLNRIAKKQIAVIHDLIPLKYPSNFPAGVRGNINIFLNKLALRNYDLIITDSEASKKDIINILHINEKKIKVIYPCLPKTFTESKNSKVKSQKYNSKLKSDKKSTTNYELLTTPYCLYVGDATWNKNLVNIAKAIKIANVTCVFVGKVFESFSGKAQIPVLSNRLGPRQRRGEAAKNMVSSFSHSWQKQLKEFSEITKDDKRFIFLGYVKDYELFKLYEQASVNLLLSSAEGFGFSYLEAANFSCPSLLSNIPVLREISNNQALFTDPKNPHDIADKIGEIYFNQDLKNQLGTAAKKRSQYFSTKKFKKEFLAVI